MSLDEINKNEVDIVIGALNADLTPFLNSWRPFFSGFHLIIVKDPDLKEELNVPQGFDVDIYSKTDMEKIVGSSSDSAMFFSGYSCRYFGYLVSKKKYIVSIDDDCVPAKDPRGFLVDAVSQHVNNLENPATPLFFNTLYDPYREGADFVRGYPFSLRSGVPCAASCGLWLNLADLDAPTQALKTEQRNTSYVDVVMTVPLKAMLPISGINIGFNRELIGPALVPALRIAGEGRVRWETLEDVWCGMCLKHISDHLGYGVKTGLPYVWRNEKGDAVESLRKKWEGMKLMEKSVPFFESLKLPESAVTVGDCVVELAKAVKEQLGSDDPAFTQAADAMVKWVKLWSSVNPVVKVELMNLSP